MIVPPIQADIAPAYVHQSNIPTRNEASRRVVVSSTLPGVHGFPEGHMSADPNGKSVHSPANPGTTSPLRVQAHTSGSLSTARPVSEFTEFARERHGGETDSTVSGAGASSNDSSSASKFVPTGHYSRDVRDMHGFLIGPRLGFHPEERVATLVPGSVPTEVPLNLSEAQPEAITSASGSSNVDTTHSFRRGTRDPASHIARLLNDSVPGNHTDNQPLDPGIRDEPSLEPVPGLTNQNSASFPDKSPAHSLLEATSQLVATPDPAPPQVHGHNTVVDPSALTVGPRIVAQDNLSIPLPQTTATPPAPAHYVHFYPDSTASTIMPVQTLASVSNPNAPATATLPNGTLPTEAGLLIPALGYNIEVPTLASVALPASSDQSNTANTPQNPQDMPLSASGNLFEPVAKSFKGSTDTILKPQKASRSVLAYLLNYWKNNKGSGLERCCFCSCDLLCGSHDENESSVDRVNRHKCYLYKTCAAFWVILFIVMILILLSPGIRSGVADVAVMAWEASFGWEDPPSQGGTFNPTVA